MSVDVDPNFYADLAFISDDPDEVRVIGFRRGAELLYGAIRDAPGHEAQDFGFFPLAALWRHHLELGLKAALTEVRRLWGPAEVAPATHDLVRLWGDLRRVLEEHVAEESRLGRHQITLALKELSSLDPDSQSFRYGRATDGQPTLPDASAVDLASFHRSAMDISNYLGALRAMVDHLTEARSEMGGEGCPGE